MICFVAVFSLCIDVVICFLVKLSMGTCFPTCHFFYCMQFSKDFKFGIFHFLKLQNITLNKIMN